MDFQDIMFRHNCVEMIHLFVHQLMQQVNQQAVTGVETMVMTMVFHLMDLHEH